MTLEKAIKMIEEQYKKAEKLEFVRNPLAYVLYNVWKEAERASSEAER